MTPLAVNPTVVILRGDGNRVASVATNIAPDVNIIVVDTAQQFNEQSAGLAYVNTVAE